MERISDRHEGDLGGRLEPFNQIQPLAVAVVVAPDAAHLVSRDAASFTSVRLWC